MNVEDICIIKRDGKRENFSAHKISSAIGKAFTATSHTHGNSPMQTGNWP